MIILASKSPRRKELMKQIVSSFEIITADIDESSSYIRGPEKAVKDISYRKALEVFKTHPNDIVIGADTIVVLNEQIIGKPVDIKDAKRILKLLSDKTHQVMTGYTIMTKDKTVTNVVISDVSFNKLNDQLIDQYIKTNSPMDKAGAYGVQDNARFPIIKKVNGSIDNVVGFPINEIKNDLKNFKY